MRPTLLICTALLLLLSTNQSWAQRGVFATLEEVLTESFPDTEPSSETLWLPKETKERFSQDLGFDILGLRVRYWRVEARTVWILEEIGKEYPITFAYTIEGIGTKNASISSARVMEYRETRGGEIRHAFFRAQYDGASLKEHNLDRKIDGITGATLSVRAMTKTAKMALWLHRAVTSPS